MRRQCHRSREAQGHEPTSRSDNFQIEGNEQKRAEKKSENVEQERISDHPRDDVKDGPYFAEVRFGIFLRRTFSNTIDQATSSDKCYADGRNKREKSRPRPIARAQAKPIRLD